MRLCVAPRELSQINGVIESAYLCALPVVVVLSQVQEEDFQVGAILRNLSVG